MLDVISITQTEHLAKLREISEKENVHEQIEHLVKAIDAKKSNILKLQAANQQLQDRAHEYTLTSAMADSRTAYAISLYSKISNITWNYAADNSHLAGCKSLFSRLLLVLTSPSSPLTYTHSCDRYWQ